MAKDKVEKGEKRYTVAQKKSNQGQRDFNTIHETLNFTNSIYYNYCWKKEENVEENKGDTKRRLMTLSERKKRKKKKRKIPVWSS